MGCTYKKKILTGGSFGTGPSIIKSITGNKMKKVERSGERVHVNMIAYLGNFQGAPFYGRAMRGFLKCKRY